MDTNDTVETSVREFIAVTLLQADNPSELTDTMHLVESGIVDSINVLRLVDFLEESYNITVEPTDIREFVTIANIGKIVRARMAGESVRLN